MVDLAGIPNRFMEIGIPLMHEPASFKGVFVGPGVTVVGCVKSKSQFKVDIYICKRSPCASAKLY